jgi:hypothetical protein
MKYIISILIFMTSLMSLSNDNFDRDVFKFLDQFKKSVNYEIISAGPFILKSYDEFLSVFHVPYNHKLGDFHGAIIRLNQPDYSDVDLRKMSSLALKSQSFYSVVYPLFEYENVNMIIDGEGVVSECNGYEIYNFDDNELTIYKENHIMILRTKSEMYVRKLLDDELFSCLLDLINEE